MTINNNPIQVQGLQTLDFEKVIDLNNNAGLKNSSTIKLGENGFEAKSLRLKEKLFGVDSTTRQQTRDDLLRIHDSLVKRFGFEAANTLYESHLKSAERSGKLTAGNLRNLLKAVAKYDSSDNILANIQNDTQQAGGIVRLKNGFTLLSQGVKDALQASGLRESHLRQTLNRAEFCLTETAYGHGAVSQLTRNVDAVQRDLQRLVNDLNGRGVDELVNHLENLRTALGERRSLLNAQEQTNPFSGKNAQPMVSSIFAGAINTLNALIAAQTDPSVKNRLSAAKNALSNDWANKMTELKSLGNAEMSKAQIQSLGKLKETVAKTVQQAVGDLVDKKTLSANMKNEFQRTLNTAQWGLIRREIPMVQTGGIGGVSSTVTAVSTLKPANQIGAVGESLRDDHLNGVNSGDSKSPHAMNLWQTQFSVKKPDGSEKVLFQGVRHGVLDAYGIKDEQRRTAANNNRAKEAFTAALESNPNLLAQARGAAPGQVIDLPIVSTSLLTPLYVPYEGSKYLHQTSAWTQACNGQGNIDLRVSDGQGGYKTVTVHPQVLTFNYSVDTNGQKLGAGAWSSNRVGERNSVAMKALLGDPTRPNELDANTLVGKFLNRLDPEHNQEDAVLRDKILLLRKQICDMVKDKAYKTDGLDPYAMPARIALLAHLVGATPCFNCKSGKDRTGQLDVTVKTLAYQLETGQLQQDYKAKPADHRQQMERIAMNSGQHEIQQLNTGLAGNKIASGWASPKGIHNEFSSDALKYYGGLSNQVSS